MNKGLSADDTDFSAEGIAFQERAERRKHEIYDKAYSGPTSRAWR